MIKLLKRALLIVAAIWASLNLGACLERQPEADTLVYKGPVELSIDVGTTLVGTDILYVAALEDGRAEFQIDGTTATKKVGDSLNWSGEPMPGVALTFKLRLLIINEERVHAGGAITLTVTETAPEGSEVDESLPIRFAVPVTYGVERGELIPATAITYEGRDEANGAVLGGIDEYPYRQVGDSVVWTGRLREDVYLKLDLRVLYFSETTLRVGGIATIWLDAAPR